MSEWNAWFNLNKIKNKKRSFISIGIFPLEILHLHSSLHSLRFIQLQMKCKEVEQVRELNERKEGRNGGVSCWPPRKDNQGHKEENVMEGTILHLGNE